MSTLVQYVSGEHVARFFRTMRTIYSRITHPKSGKGADEYTERDKFIVNSWSFIEGHIRRSLKTKSTAKVIFWFNKLISNDLK